MSKRMPNDSNTLKNYHTIWIPITPYTVPTSYSLFVINQKYKSERSIDLKYLINLMKM